MNSKLLASGVLAVVLMGAGCDETMPFHYAKAGRLVDSTTGQGLMGLEVRCMVEERDCDDDCDCGHCDCDCEVEYKEHSKTYSARDGYFYVPYDEPCILFITDIDQERNSGWFDERKVEFCSDDSELLVELTPLATTCTPTDHRCGD